MGSLKPIERRIAHDLKRFPFKLASLGIDRYDTSDTKNLIGSWSCDAWKESLMRVSPLKIEELLRGLALMDQWCYLTKAPVDDVRERALFECDTSLEFELTATEDPIFRYIQGGHVT
jgi:hypothetical protein